MRLIQCDLEFEGLQIPPELFQALGCLLEHLLIGGFLSELQPGFRLFDLRYERLPPFHNTSKCGPFLE